MAEFVHLHLHTEYSLLDGACRIGELLDEAERLKMPALAVTEHGNLFSSIVFHDKARQRGIKPILGCEVYVAPGSRLTKSGPPGETANHLILLAENDEGFTNLVKLTSSAYTEGFYYKPRIDKELLAQHSTGLIGLSSCLKGEVPSELRADQIERGRRRPRRPYRDILGRGQLLPRASVPGDRGAADREQRPAAARARPGHAAGVHERRALPAARRLPAARHAALHRHRQDGERCRAHEVLRRSVLPEDAGGNGARSSATCRRRCATRWRSPSAATSTCRTAARTCRTSRCPTGSPLDELLRARGARRASTCACRGCRSWRAAGQPAAFHRRVPRRACSTRSMSSSGCSTRATS